MFQFLLDVHVAVKLGTRACVESFSGARAAPAISGMEQLMAETVSKPSARLCPLGQKNDDIANKTLERVLL